MMEDKIDAFNTAIRLLEIERDKLKPTLRSLKILIREKIKHHLVIRELVYGFSTSVESLNDEEIAYIYMRVQAL